MQREGKRCGREKRKGEGCEGSEGGSTYLSTPNIDKERPNAMNKVGDLLNPKVEEQARRAQCLRTNRAMQCAGLQRVVWALECTGLPAAVPGRRREDSAKGMRLAQYSRRLSACRKWAKSESELDGRYDPNPKLPEEVLADLDRLLPRTNRNKESASHHASRG